MSTRYQILQHEQKPYWLPGCPLLMASHALTKDTTTDLVFLQCKFENLSNKRIKALTIHVECYDVTNQPLAPVDNFTYLDIDVTNAMTFGDQTPVSLPDRETRAFHIIPQKIVFADNSIWENTANQPFVLAPYEQRHISSLGDLADMLIFPLGKMDLLSAAAERLCWIAQKPVPLVVYRLIRYLH